MQIAVRLDSYQPFEETAMNQEEAQLLVSAIEAVQARSEFASAYSACKAANVPFADYKEARFLVYGLNTAL